MIYVTNILAGPLVLLVWLIDTYLFIVTVRLVLGQVGTADLLAARRTLQQITDPPARAVHRWISRRRNRPTPIWVAWPVVLLGGLILRHLLLAIILAGFQQT